MRENNPLPTKRDNGKYGFGVSQERILEFGNVFPQVTKSSLVPIIGALENDERHETL